MRNLLLSVALIAVPVAGFALVESVIAPPSATISVSSGLGDLTAYETIVTDTKRIAATGDLAAAETRITDLETLWDENAKALLKADPGAWGAVDGAADAAFSALRARTPDPKKVDVALTALAETLAAPVPAASGPVQQVAGIDVTDANGHALPCEEMIGQLRDATDGKTPPPDLATLQSKALERCNADDDTRADAFAAQAIALMKG